MNIMRKYILCVLVLVMIATIECVTTVSHNSPEAYNKRGIDNAKSGEYQQAIEDFNQTIRLDSNNAKAYYNRGLVYAHLGKSQQALKDLNQAIRLDPNNATAYFSRGHVLYDLGNKDLSCDDWQKACELGLCEGLTQAKNKNICQ
jgi:tetratricopeptide (TPR) repeat protein